MGNESITLAHDSRAAIANYDKALELYPEYADAWIRKGITLFNDGRYIEAEECLTRAVKLRPAEFKAVYNRGKLRLKQQETEGAIADGQGYHPETRPCRSTRTLWRCPDAGRKRSRSCITVEAGRRTSKKIIQEISHTYLIIRNLFSTFVLLYID